MGTASLVIGIIAFLGSFIPFVHYFLLLPALLGLILGAVAISQNIKRKQKIKAAFTGLMLNMFALIVGAVVTYIFYEETVEIIEENMPVIVDEVKRIETEKE